MIGEHILTLVDETKTKGWNFAVFKNEGLPTGEYFYQLTAADFSKTGRMLLIK